MLKQASILLENIGAIFGVDFEMTLKYQGVKEYHMLAHIGC